MSGDPFFLQTTLLLNGDGANGSTTFTDSSLSPKTATVLGDARISTAQSKFGGASMFFDGAVDRIRIQNSGDLALGTGDFTVEMRVYPQSAVGYQCIVLILSTTTGYMYLGIDTGSTGTPLFYKDGNVITASRNFTINTWQHFALVRSRSVCTMFLDGISVGSAAFTTDIVSPGYVLIGGTDENIQYFNGYIDDLRVTKGIARYTTDFTPPTEAHPTFLGASYAALVAPELYMAGADLPASAAHLLPSIRLGADAEHGGIYRITGTVKEKGNPTNTPLRRRVLLLDERSQLVIRETWSNAATGAYAFAGIRGDITYTVMTFDSAKNYRAVIADNLTPELMP